MEQVVLKAQKKDDSGKSVARKLRAEGLEPGVIYGLGKETVALAVQRRELYELLEKATGGNVLISLDMAEMQIDADTAALIKEIQWSPVHKEALSVDLQWISLKEPVTVSVNSLLPAGLKIGLMADRTGGGLLTVNAALSILSGSAVAIKV